MVEAEAEALDCARVNIIDDPRARFHWADALTFRPESLAETVVMNPPFHIGRDGRPGAWALRSSRPPSGCWRPMARLWLVANRHLPYDAALTAAFLEVETIGGDGAFRVIRAAKPRRARPLSQTRSCPMSLSVSGKTAIVTGAANGIGLAVARHLVDKGANVMFADMDEARLEAEVGEEARAEGPVRMFAGDLTQKLTIANLLSATVDAFDRVDILVNASRRCAALGPAEPRCRRGRDAVAAECA